MNVGELIRQHLIDTEGYPKNRRPPWWIDYKLCITGLAHKEVSELTVDDINEFVRLLAAHGVKANAIKDALTCVQSALRWLKQKRINEIRKARRIERREWGRNHPPPPPRPDPIQEAWKLQEAIRLAIYRERRTLDLESLKIKQEIFKEYEARAIRGLDVPDGVPLSKSVRVAQLYRKGISTKTIAIQYNISQRMVYKYLDQLEIPRDWTRRK